MRMRLTEDSMSASRIFRRMAAGLPVCDMRLSRHELRRFAFVSEGAIVVAFSGDSAAHRLSWNAARKQRVTECDELGGVDEALFSQLMVRPQVSWRHCRALQVAQQSAAAASGWG